MRRSIGFVALMISGIAVAEPGGLQDALTAQPVDEIVVTAARSPRRASLLPASVTVISGEEIEAQHAESINEVLRYVNGLYLQQQGGRGGRADIHLRGLDPNHVVVMVDGVRLNDITNSRGGSFDPTTLSPLAIDRIEIVRGPQSAVYGSDPLAGVINIITRRVAADAEPETTLKGGGGRYETGHVRGITSTGLGFGGLTLAGSYDHNGAPHDSGGYEGGNLKATLDSEAALGGPVVFASRKQLRVNDSKASSFPDASGGYDLAVRRELEQRDGTELSGGVQLDLGWANWMNVAFQVDHAHSWEDLASPGVEESFPSAGNGLPATVAATEMGRTHVGLVASTNVVEVLAVNLGFDLVWETGNRRSVMDLGGPVPSDFALDRRTAGIFLEGAYEVVPGISLSASLRGDLPEDEEAEFSPSVGGSVDIPMTPLTVFGSW
jgi:vitamin B12 transporter